MITAEQVHEALRGVPEPCSIAMRDELDICEMGLVERVDVEGDHVRVELLLTDTSCVHYAAMRRYIADALLDLDGVEAVEVALCTTRLWTPDRVRRRAPLPPPRREERQAQRSADAQRQADETASSPYTGRSGPPSSRGTRSASRTRGTAQ